MKVLGFLWQWKLATTAILSRRFFSSINAHSAYKRLRAIERKGLIQLNSEPSGDIFYWILTKKGYSAIKPHLPALEQEGYKSEYMFHDYMVLCFHLGDWLAGTPKGALFVSEQQMRRYEKPEYPSWTPKDHSHRSDGYWNVGGKIVSLEVELTCKSEGDYYTVSKFYNRNDSIDSIFWLVPSTTIAKRILSYLESAQHERNAAHNFITMPDFKSNGWAATLAIGCEQGKTVREILGKWLGNSWEIFPAETMFDGGKCSINHRSYAQSTWNSKRLQTPITT